MRPVEAASFTWKRVQFDAAPVPIKPSSLTHFERHQDKQDFKTSGAEVTYEELQGTTVTCRHAAHTERADYRVCSNHAQR